MVNKRLCAIEIVEPIYHRNNVFNWNIGLDIMYRIKNESSMF